MQPVVQNTGESPKGPLELRVYLPTSTAGNECRGTIYQDDGHTFAYQKGEFLRVSYSCQVSASSVTVAGNLETNSFKPWWKSAEVMLYGVSASPKEVRLGDEVIHEWRFDRQTRAVTLTLPDALKNWTVRLAF
jgi:alpha-glucosidase